MRRKKAITSLVGIVLVAVVALGLTFWKGNEPLLGLDLRGGISVVLKPEGAIDDDRMAAAIAIMNQRVNSIGVAEPDIHREGDTIVVQLAGVKDPDKAIELVGQTAELRFRPVLSVLGPDTTTETQGTTPGSTPGTTPDTAPAGATPAPAAATDSTVAPAAVTPAAPTTTAAPSSTQQQGAGLPEGESAAGAVAAQTPTTVSDRPPPTVAPAAGASPTTSQQLSQEQIQQLLAQQQAQGGATAGTTANKPTTPADQDDALKTVVLPGDPRTGSGGQRYELGPAQLTGAALDGASAGLNSQTGQWEVRPRFKPGADGIDKFNAMAATCKPVSAACPTGQIAITLDGKVISAPQIEPTESAFKPFSADSITISGSFGEDDANRVATALKYGALPVKLTPQSTEIVSATLGGDALRAGLLAGLVGLILVAIYMIAFYRILGLLAILKLGIEGALIWAIISFLGSTVGLALTLAGVTGIIVSIGVSLDSNVVYYEHLREDIRNGRTVRSAVDKSFASAFSTILKADGASLLGATLLYWLAVGPVRGFAFYLGLSTVLDLISSYFYMRPVVFLATSSKMCRTRPGMFGLPPAAAIAEGDGPTRPTRPSNAKGKAARADKPAPAEASREGKADPAGVEDDGTPDKIEDATEKVDPATTGAN